MAAAVIVLGGVAAAFSQFVPEYFSSGDRASTPEAVLAELRSLTPEEKSIEGGIGQLDPDGIVRLASFEAENGLATIYAAPSVAGSGFCEVHTIDEVIVGGGCYGERSWQSFPHIVHRASEWGDIAVLMGLLEEPTAQIEVRFEDGSVRASAVRGPWWIYVVGGEELEPGHRPAELIALDQDGGRVASQKLDPR